MLFRSLLLTVPDAHTPPARHGHRPCFSRRAARQCRRTPPSRRVASPHEGRPTSSNAHRGRERRRAVPGRGRPGYHRPRPRPSTQSCPPTRDPSRTQAPHPRAILLRSQTPQQIPLPLQGLARLQGQTPSPVARTPLGYPEQRLFPGRFTPFPSPLRPPAAVRRRTDTLLLFHPTPRVASAHVSQLHVSRNTPPLSRHLTAHSADAHTGRYTKGSFAVQQRGRTHAGSSQAHRGQSRISRFHVFFAVNVTTARLRKAWS